MCLSIDSIICPVSSCVLCFLSFNDILVRFFVEFFSRAIMFCDWPRRFMNHFFVCLVGSIVCFLSVIFIACGSRSSTVSNEKELVCRAHLTFLSTEIACCQTTNWWGDARVVVLCSDPKFNFIQCHFSISSNFSTGTKKSIKFSHSNQDLAEWHKSKKRQKNFKSLKLCQSRFYSQIHECRSVVPLKKSFGRRLAGEKYCP